VRVRRIAIDRDYPTIKTWWEKRGSEAPSPGLLPPVGVISEDNGIPLACAFLYEAVGCSIAMVEWEATNPDYKSALIQVRALTQIFDFFETFCRDKGIAVVLSWVAEDRGDGRLLARRNWIKCPGERHEMMAFETHPEEALCPS